MEKHVDFAHLLRWPFLLGWLMVLAVWCGVLYLPLDRPTGWDSYSLELWFRNDTGAAMMLKPAWAGYTMLLLFGPLATLSPNRLWHFHLADRDLIPRRMLFASAVALGVLNMSLLEVGIVQYTVAHVVDTLRADQIAPIAPLHRLGGIVLLSFIWGNLLEAIVRRPNRVLYLNYIVLVNIFAAGLVSLLLSGFVQGFASLNLQKPQLPGITAALMMQITVVLWAMGTSVVLMFGIRPFFRYSNSRCMKCGYDLQGSLEHGDGTCPECGTAIEQAQ
jgi:hypothetical protein